MIARKHRSTAGTIPRKRGPKSRHSAMFKKTQGDQKDPKINRRGRPKGSGNKMPREVREALIAAAMWHGDGTGRVKMKEGTFVKPGKAGRDELDGYFRWAFQNLPMQAFQAMLKQLPSSTEITGPEGGPIQIMNVPSEILSKMTTSELKSFIKVINLVNGETSNDAIAGPGEEMPGDASAYAREIGLLPPSS